MASANPSPPYQTFSALYTHLQAIHPAPVRPPTSTKPSAPLSSAIASLSLHPTLEAALHILNQDLPSAHFLVRHMQSPPAYEGMFLHGILHRVEGDYENARAWYRSASKSEGDEVFGAVWPGGVEEGLGFIDRVEGFVKRGEGNEGDLEGKSRREIDGVVEWCRGKFGEGEVRDARGAWVRPSEEHRKMAEGMVVGGEGWRKF